MDEQQPKAISIEIHLDIDQVDKDALAVMEQAGQEFADRQYWRHWNNDWHLPEEQQKERVAHWRAVKDRVGEIVKQTRTELLTNEIDKVMKGMD